jgi:transcription initiation factor TFIIH subunit 2
VPSVLRDATAIQRGIIRHLYLVVDLSLSMLERDLRPSRLELSLQYAAEYVTEYFDQNPISQMAIIGMKDGVAVRLTALSGPRCPCRWRGRDVETRTGNSVEHQAALKAKDERIKLKLEPSGEPSLQNALEMARNGLSYVQRAILNRESASRRTDISRLTDPERCSSSMAHSRPAIRTTFTPPSMPSSRTSAPGCLRYDCPRRALHRVRVNIIGLSAAMAVCSEICKRTGGASLSLG